MNNVTSKQKTEELLPRALNLLGLVRQYGHQHLAEISNQIHSQNPLELIASCLFIRLLRSLESIDLLAKEKHEESAGCIVRTMVEASMHLWECGQDKKWVNRYIRGGLTQQRALITKVLEASQMPIDGLNRIDLEKKQREIDIDIVNVDAERLPSLWSQVRGTEMEGIYLTAYCTTSSNHIHVGVRSLRRYLNVDPTGAIIGIDPKSDDGSLIPIVFTSCWAVLSAIGSIAKIFDTTWKDELPEDVSEHFEFLKSRVQTEPSELDEAVYE